MLLALQDVGIDNGLHRVVQNLPAVRAADVVIVVAGMDGSLPSVIAGLVDSPVVRVPLGGQVACCTYGYETGRSSLCIFRNNPLSGQDGGLEAFVSHASCN